MALKLFIRSQSMGEQLDREVSIYKRISDASSTHPGRGAVRELLDSFDIAGPEGLHRCLVHPPLWENLLTFLHRNPVGRLPVPVLAFILRRMFQALNFLHTACQVVHTDIKADNIMFGIEDDSVFTAFEEEELIDPCPRKTVDGRSIYVSRELQIPKAWGAPVLCDLGSAVTGKVEHLEDVQPDIYGAPEVIVEAPWSYSIDIWNTGCVIWDLFEGGHLFTDTIQSLRDTGAEHTLQRSLLSLDHLHRRCCKWAGRATSSSRKPGTYMAPTRGCWLAHHLRKGRLP
ncbi:serine/threonine-protein kinase SRPK3 [Verticillium dahliae VdLs.17]|uniref:Serine/threonine-protein kinase SRPK3 n=1 Tax=Verticillium dahliae (strain VdLs.17 / ATCC MYA-4575 / FGSC 10137) TaxID=498257 RepID=G2WX86_VERDV|nr:serine/threonine-protein kinase SRPK3 [Verticillium dahliae VdLs.17]EGY21341.1 serine/threonine-protein kinase SRPK3 [Verticillium dahliae VdLs.17]KAH6707339.1 serine/threonine-protein kinase SRPK3 [Verticillium dahliae]